MDYGLIGEKLGHSYSKEIHERLADYTYDLCPLSKDEFDPFMKERPFRAINVTIPYKKLVIPYCSVLDDLASEIGAVNTITNINGDLYGYNTDYQGFYYMVRKHNVDMKDKKVVVLGNGGAAEAIRAVVNHCGAKELITVTARGLNGAIKYDECFEKHTDAKIIINTSPVGMYPNVDDCPVDISRFPSCQAVLDIIYNPSETKLTESAKNRGIPAFTGLEMLIAQAKYAVEIFINTSISDEKIDEIYEEMTKEFAP